LKNKPDGCVIWLWFNEKTMPDLGHKIARHSKGDQSGYKAERPNKRVINKGQFSTFASMNAIAQELFG